MTTTIALNMMVKNAATVMNRVLMPVLPYVDEVVIVDTGSTDGTRELITTIIDQSPLTRPDLRFELIAVNERSDPHLYLHDEAATFGKGLPGPFTGKPFLARWDLTRQMALDATRSDLMIFLDADDVWKGDQALAGPRLSSLATLMQAKNLDVLYLPYEYRHDQAGNPSYHQIRERMCRVGNARWKGHTHEVLVPIHSDRVLALDDPTVMDMHDNLDPGNQISHRAFKILWKEWEARTSNDRDPHLLFQLGHEARNVSPDLALDLLEAAIAAESTAAVYRATASVERGYLYEVNRDDLDNAEAQYNQAQRFYPTLPEAALGLGRVALKRGEYLTAMDHLGRALDLADTREARMIHHDPRDRFGRCRAYLALAQAHAGLHAKAQETARAAEGHLGPYELSSLFTIIARHARQTSEQQTPDGTP